MTQQLLIFVDQSTDTGMFSVVEFRRMPGGSFDAEYVDDGATDASWRSESREEAAMVRDRWEFWRRRKWADQEVGQWAVGADGLPDVVFDAPDTPTTPAPGAGVKAALAGILSDRGVRGRVGSGLVYLRGPKGPVGLVYLRGPKGPVVVSVSAQAHNTSQSAYAGPSTVEGDHLFSMRSASCEGDRIERASGIFHKMLDRLIESGHLRSTS